MKITTLLENKTTCDALRCEHGLSLYIETAKHKILFDSGASDAFWENAKALGIDLAQVDIAFLSHAHNDHCGGLLTFLRGNRTAKVYLQKEAFGDYYVVTPTKCAFIGLDPKLHEYADRFVMAEGVTKLDEELTLFSGIRTHELLSEANATLREKVGGDYPRDAFRHEQDLLVTEHGKTVLFCWLRPQRHHQHHQPRRGHSGPCAGLCVRGLPSLQSLARSERAESPCGRGGRAPARAEGDALRHRPLHRRRRLRLAARNAGRPPRLHGDRNDLYDLIF
ncbi:MAG: MBL fold metallo-hydrolase [Oscillospiraceae bacterium]